MLSCILLHLFECTPRSNSGRIISIILVLLVKDTETNEWCLGRSSRLALLCFIAAGVSSSSYSYKTRLEMVGENFRRVDEFQKGTCLACCCACRHSSPGHAWTTFFQLRFQILQPFAAAHALPSQILRLIVHADGQSKSLNNSHPQAALRCGQPVLFFRWDWVRECPSQKRLPAAEFRRVTFQREKAWMQRTGKVNGYREPVMRWIVLKQWYDMIFRPRASKFWAVLEFYFGGCPILTHPCTQFSGISCVKAYNYSKPSYSPSNLSST